MTAYLDTAYSSGRVPHQAPTQALRPSIFKRMTGRRLPWGNTQELVPDTFMAPEPNDLRLEEEKSNQRSEELAKGLYKPAPLEHVDFHDRCDHTHYRHAPWGGAAHFWIHLATFGKGCFFLFLLLGGAGVLLEGFRSHQGFLDASAEYAVILVFQMLLPSLTVWAFASLIIHKLPRLWARPAKGPKWELNRRTGMITVFKHKKGVASERSAPFHEFDAYINTSPDRQGLPMNVLSIEHRYSDLSIYFGDLLPPDRNTHQACALWDFIQNYMDISHPLPDAPLFEEHRHKDPTTAEHDKATGRNPRYWTDMDDETFKQVKRDMWTRVAMIDTFSRPNLMAQYVKYPL